MFLLLSQHAVGPLKHGNMIAHMRTIVPQRLFVFASYSDLSFALSLSKGSPFMFRQAHHETDCYHFNMLLIYVTGPSPLGSHLRGNDE